MFYFLPNNSPRTALSVLALVVCLGLGWCGCNLQTAPVDSSKAGEQPVKVGYVLHSLNEFTQIIKQGAEDAGQAEKIKVDVVGPAGFVATDAIAMFEGMTQKQVGGLVVIPMPAEVWVTPIHQATQGGIPVLTANVTCLGSSANAWFGQDEYASGAILARELRKFLASEGKSEGKILVGICSPGVSVLEQRYAGFKTGMEGSSFEISNPYDVNTENTANYAAWENLASGTPEVVAMVGLCSMDLPNLAKLKQRTSGRWLVAGYDLGRETLDAIKSGTVQVSLGQHPYLQGYLPVAALARHLRDKRPLPRGWIDVGTEVVTKANASAVYARETDQVAQRNWYAEYISKNFADLNAVAKPLPTAKE